MGLEGVEGIMKPLEVAQHHRGRNGPIEEGTSRTMVTLGSHGQVERVVEGPQDGRLLLGIEGGGRRL